MKLDPQPEDLPITVSVRGDTNVKFTAEYISKRFKVERC